MAMKTKDAENHENKQALIQYSSSRISHLPQHIGGRESIIFLLPNILTIFSQDEIFTGKKLKDIASVL